MKKFIWLSFDLGIKGDYEGLYAWLDSQNAKECGDNLACFHYQSTSDLLSELKTHLSSAVQIDKRSRIYVIYLDPQTEKQKGVFLFGKRKSPPWAGYGPSFIQEEDNG